MNKSAILETPPTNNIVTVRIIRDNQNKDGWTIRKLSDGKLGFIQNLDTIIESIEAGQLWEAAIITEKPKFDIVSLEHCIKY